MYLDERNARILLRDGSSLQTSFEYARNIINNRQDDNLYAVTDSDTEKYEYISGKKISKEVEDIEVTPKTHYTSEGIINELLTRISSSQRYIYEHLYDKRIAEELDYFEKTNNIVFLLRIAKMIDKFKEDGEVWGVGRGSGCASLILYLLEVHDVDPVKYDIPFSEMSKEVNYYDD